MIFQDDFFEFTKDDYDFDAVFENNFYDPEFKDRELPDDLFMEFYNDLKETPGIIVLQPHVLQERDVSRLVYVETTPTGDVEFTMGPKDVEPKEKVYLTPDYTPAIAVLKYSFELDKNPEKDIQFPDIPIAHPTIPKSANELTPSFLQLEKYMYSRSAIIYDPSYDFKQERENESYIEPCSDSMLKKQVMDKLQPKSFIFSARKDISRRMSFTRYVTLQFNPFHPGACQHIEHDFKDDGRIITGYFQWGRRRQKFRFDRESTWFRLHSDVWLGVLSREYHYLGVFDMVGNFDFIKELPGLQGVLKKDYYYSSPYVIEGYHTKETHESPYSCIGMNRGPGYYRSYAQTYPLPIKLSDELSNFEDISSDYIVQIVEGRPHEINVIHKNTGQNIVQLMKGKNKVRYKGSSLHFVEYSVRTGKLKVLREVDYETHIKYYKVGEVLFGSFPRNCEYSLIRPFHEISLIDYLQLRETEEGRKIEARMVVEQTRKISDMKALSVISDEQEYDIEAEWDEQAAFDAFLGDCEDD